MIIFYDKQTRDVIGVFEGRVHSDDQLKAWVGDRDHTNRIVIQWKPVMVVVYINGRSFDASWTEWQEWLAKEEQKPIASQRAYKILNIIYEPEYHDKELANKLDQNPTLAYSYKVNPETLALEPKDGIQ